MFGNILEKNLSRSLTLSDGSYAFLWERPLTVTIMIFAVLALLLPLFSLWREKCRSVSTADTAETAQEDMEISK